MKLPCRGRPASACSSWKRSNHWRAVDAAGRSYPNSAARPRSRRSPSKSSRQSPPSALSITKASTNCPCPKPFADFFAGRWRSAVASTPLRRPTSISNADPACGVTASVSPPRRSRSRAFASGRRIAHLRGEAYTMRLTDWGEPQWGGSLLPAEGERGSSRGGERPGGEEEERGGGDRGRVGQRTAQRVRQRR